MARHKLVDAKIRGLNTPGIYGDGDGLYLRLQTAGGKSWVFIWKRYGVRREIGLGPYGTGAGQVSLAAARIKADEARAIVGQGGDPKTDLAERRAGVRVLTFGKITHEYIEVMQSKWRGDKTLAAWERFSTTYTAALRKIPVDKVSDEDVLRVLRPLWHTKPETATKVRERIKLVLDHATARKLRSGPNPAQWKGHLDQMLPPPAKLANGHLAAMRYADVPAFMQRLRKSSGLAAKAVEFIVLTAARSGEARGATWEEFDLVKKVWTIPPARMKAAKEHRVPLSDAVLVLVEQMKATATNRYVFPGQRDNRPLSDVSLAKALKTATAGAITVHGFRSAFRDWVAEETNFQREVAEAALAHAVGDSVERAYRRGDALEKRRKLMEAWASYCTTVKGNSVVTIGWGA